MSNEARINNSLQITKGALQYQSRPTQFNANVSGTNGPSPGAFLVSTAGTAANLANLTRPALCRMQNLDAVNFVQWGIYDLTNTEFYPLGEILPGETYVVRLSRFLGGEYEGPGTGTVLAGNQLMFKADTAPVQVLLEAFDA